MNDELQQASRRLSGLTQRRPGVVLGLWGEPGIGKTHAAQGLLRAFPGRSWTVHATQTLPSVVQALPAPRKATLWLERTLERLARGEPADLEVTAQTLVALLTASAPAVLHVEDLHETSDEGLAFWTQVAGVVRRTRSVGLIVTSREQPPEAFEAIKLEALSAEDTRTVLEREVGANLPTAAHAWIQARAAGNPLFALEFCRFLARRGFLWNDGQHWRWRAPESEVMPVTVEALVEQRLERAAMNPELGSVVQARAMLGPAVPGALWAQVAGLEEDVWREAVDALEREGVLVGGDFAHPLYREGARRTLSQERRQTLARRALDALEHDPEAAAAFLEDARLAPGAALAVLERAANGARDGVGAARFLARTVALLEGEAQVRRALEAATGLQHRDATEAERLLEGALQARPNDPETIYSYARLLANQKRADAVEWAFARLPEAQREGAEGLAMRLICLGRMEDEAGVLTLWREHSELAETVNTEAVKVVAAAMAQLGDTASASALVSRLLERPHLPALEQVPLMEVLGMIAFHESDYAGAERHFAAALGLCAQHGLPLNVGSLNFNRALALQTLGRYAEARDAAEAAARILSESGRLPLYMTTRALIAEGLLDHGEYESAEEALLEVSAFFKTKELSVRHVEIEGCLAELYRGWAAPHSGMLALRHGRNALNCARALQNPRFLPEGLFQAALAEAAFGDPQRALGLADEACQLAAERREPRQIYMSGWARGGALAALGRRDEAIQALSEARRLAFETGVPLDAHRIGLELARVSGDFKEAGALLTWFEERGLRNGANLARRYFPELAVPEMHAPPTHRLEVLGPMQLRQSGVGTPVRGGKRKELLALLLEARIRGRGEVTALALSDVLYPGEPEEAALGALRATIFKIRSSLGPSLITTTTNGYALGPVTSDVEAFLQGGDAHLWRGPYLENVTLEIRDEQVSDALNTALASRIRALTEADAPTDFEDAVRLSQVLVQAEPYDLDALALACCAVHASGNRKALERLYTQARSRLLEVGEVLPESSAAFLQMRPGLYHAQVRADVLS